MTPLINIDSSLKSLTEDEITAAVIDARVSSMAFKNFDSVPRVLPFVLELCTSTASSWRKLTEAAHRRYWIGSAKEAVLVFHASKDCGCVRTYRLTGFSKSQEPTPGFEWQSIKDVNTFYSVMDDPAAKQVFEAWVAHQEQVTNLPTIFVSGRLNNTNVEKAFIFSKGDGCVVCGAKATCYAATTQGTQQAALLLQLPVCHAHMLAAREYPSVFVFLASLFQLSLDWEQIPKLDHIPDAMIPVIHQAVADELKAYVGRVEKRARGWHLWLDLDSQWKWLLRLNSFSDYAYLLFAPNEKSERYRADSAPDHPDLPFFPDHEHDRPGKKVEQIAPSFLYGHPLFDLKRLKKAGIEYGAYS
ncbi:hypothetical protein [Comamonas sp. 4034]|uniref:hypothetical protein n=1 Tax=Comamonas sp. 4034 TaxID=3156455 RepID=UPI003D236911